MQLELNPMAFYYLLKTIKQLFKEIILFRVQIEVIPVSMLLKVCIFLEIFSK
jgi:hypothetical protein